MKMFEDGRKNTLKYYQIKLISVKRLIIIIKTKNNHQQT